MPKIIFIQPGYAHYRKGLFDKLNTKFDISFVFCRHSSIYPTFDEPNQQWKSIWLHSDKNWFWIINLIKILSKKKYDIIISSNPGSIQSIISTITAKILKKKHVVWSLSWHEEYQYSNRNKLYKDTRRKLAQHIVRKADSVIVAGSASLRYHRMLGIPNKKIFVANQSVEPLTKNYYTAKTIDKLDIKKKYIILYFSRIINWKGLDILISAFKSIENERNDVFLLICGDGDFKNYCEGLAKKLTVKNIQFMGAIKHEYFYDYLSIADIFVLPSCIRDKSEAWGLVINEAMGVGKPIVTTDAVGSAEDLVANGINGYVVKNNDTMQLYTALKKIICGGDKLIERMGKNSIERFYEFNSYNKMFSGFKDAILYSMSNS